jgi:hypothetical protein
MMTLAAICRELIGLFVDDGSLALAILMVVVLAGISASLMPDIPLAGGVVLLLGCLGVLLVNVSRTARTAQSAGFRSHSRSAA